MSGTRYSSRYIPGSGTDPNQLTVVQVAAKKVITAQCSTALAKLFVCYLHCNGMRELAENPYVQMAILLGEDLALRLTLRLTTTTRPLDVNMIREAQATFVCNLLGYASAALCIAICAGKPVKNSDTNMQHIQTMNIVIAMSVAYALKFLLWDIKLAQRVRDGLRSCGVFNRASSGADTELLLNTGTELSDRSDGPAEAPHF